MVYVCMETDIQLTTGTIRIRCQWQILVLFYRGYVLGGLLLSLSFSRVT
jgi:hypothetical protein